MNGDLNRNDHRASEKLSPHDAACLAAILDTLPTNPRSIGEFLEGAANIIEQSDNGSFNRGDTHHTPDNPQRLSARLRQMAGDENTLTDLATVAAAREASRLPGAPQNTYGITAVCENPARHEEWGLPSDRSNTPNAEAAMHADIAARRIGPRTGHRAPETPHDRISEVEGGRGAGGDDSAPRSTPRVE